MTHTHWRVGFSPGPASTAPPSPPVRCSPDRCSKLDSPTNRIHVPAPLRSHAACRRRCHRRNSTTVPGSTVPESRLSSGSTFSASFRVGTRIVSCGMAFTVVTAWPLHVACCRTLILAGTVHARPLQCGRHPAWPSSSDPHYAGTPGVPVSSSISFCSATGAGPAGNHVGPAEVRGDQPGYRYVLQEVIEDVPLKRAQDGDVLLLCRYGGCERAE